MQINYLCISFVVFFADIFTRLFDDFISMKFLIAVFLPASPFVNFGDFCQPTRLLYLPRLLFWPKFASLPVYSALPFYLKLKSRAHLCTQLAAKVFFIFSYAPLIYSMSTYSVQCWCEFIAKIFFIFFVRFQFKEWKYFKIFISASLKMFLKLQLFVIKLPNVTSIYTKRIS